MELKINVEYPQVMELVSQLPEKDIQKLMEYIQNEYTFPVKKRIRHQKNTPIQELILQAPTWTDEEYNSYLEMRQHINQSRLQ